MSCPNSAAPKCCAPPKKPCPPAPPACSNLPATKTFTCPADECPKKEEKPCPCPAPVEKCVALGKAQPEPVCGAAKPSAPSCPAAAPSSGGNCGGNADNSCEVQPLSMDGNASCLK